MLATRRHHVILVLQPTTFSTSRIACCHVPTSIHALLDEFRQRDRPEAASLLISFFGDAVLPRGGRIWLGSLIRLLAPLDINERLIRTTVFRLGKSGWLQSQPTGRRTDYGLTPHSTRRVTRAARQIYAAQPPDWDRRWRFIMVLGELSAKEREAVRQSLYWLGFGTVHDVLFVHPDCELDAAIDALLADQLEALVPQLKPFTAAGTPIGGTASDSDLVHKAWDLDTLARQYEDFSARYKPVLDCLRDPAAQPDPATAFMLRLLLIHEYRRLMLRDPDLPAQLLPANWPGQAARMLCKEIYRRLLAPSEQHLDELFQLADGTTPPILPGALAARFRDPDPLATYGLAASP